MYASSSSTVTVSVQAFTPILGTLLLNENRRVGILARDALVGFLTRMNSVDDKLLGPNTSPRRRIVQPWEAPEGDDDEPLPYIGLFGNRERALFRQEILQQIVVGLGQLEDVTEDHQHQHREASHHQPQPSDWSNPYFPPVSTARPAAASVTDSHATRSSPSISQRNSPIPDYSPGVDFPPGTAATPKSVDNDVYALVIFCCFQLNS
jgi:serine/threonine-protein phosphatase 4 regulatory subunit 1